MATIQGTEQLARTIAQLEARIAQLERNQRVSQLGYSTVDNGTITVNDDQGNPMILIGAQDDGSFAMSATGDNNSPAPSQPTLIPGVGEIHAIWDGLMSDGSDPLSDFAVLQVHVSTTVNFTPDFTTLQGVLHGPGNFRIGNLFNQTTYYVCFVVINNAGNESPPSTQTSAQPVYTAAVLTYAGTPALDTLMASVSAAGSIDQYGNVVFPGTVAYGVGDNSYIQLRPGDTAEVRISSGNVHEWVPTVFANGITDYGGGVQGTSTIIQTPLVFGQTGYGQIVLNSASSDLANDPTLDFFVFDSTGTQSGQMSISPDVFNLEVTAGGFANGVQVNLNGINNTLLMGAGFGLGANTQAVYFDTINGAIVFSNPIFAATTAGGTTLAQWNSGTLQNSWASSNLKYKLMPWGAVRVLAVIDPSAVTGGFPSTVMTLPVGFRPSSTQDHTAGFHTATGAGQGIFYRVASTGTIQVFNATTGSGVLVLDIEIPLDY